MALQNTLCNPWTKCTTAENKFSSAHGSVAFLSEVQEEGKQTLCYFEMRMDMRPCCIQWRNKRGGGGRGGRVLPRDFWQGNFCYPTGKKEARKKGERGENWEGRKENYKREGGKLKTEGGKVTKWGGYFFFFFAFNFSKPLKFVLGLPKRKFSRGGERISHWEKIRKGDSSCPCRKIFLLRPCLHLYNTSHHFDYIFCTRVHIQQQTETMCMFQENIKCAVM